MVELKKDKKSPTWIVTTTDKEGFHRQLNLTADELDELTRMWNLKKKKQHVHTED